MIKDEIVHVKGYPKKLIVFLHGYIDSPDYIDKNVQILLNNLDDIAIHIPQSPQACEIYPAKYQWYSMHRFDPNDDRKFVASWDEYIKIYNKMKPGIIEAFNIINPYIDNCLYEYGLSDKDLYICGYSQGATLSIYTALMRDNPVAGLVSFCGVFAPSDFLSKKHKSTTDVLLIHGDKDNQVRYEVMDFSKKELENIGCNVKTYTIHNGIHRLTGEGMAEASDFIVSKNIKKKAI